MKTLGERLRYAREMADGGDGISQSELARRVGMKAQSIQAIEAGKVTRSRYITEIARVLKVRSEWLAEGKGSKPQPQDYPDGENVVFSGKPLTISMQIDELDVAASAGPGQEIEAEMIRGEWQFPSEVIRIATQAPAERIKIIRVVGESMAPMFLPNDRVMVDLDDRKPSPGGIFVLWDGLGTVVKRVDYVAFSDPPRVKITSVNPAYDPYERVLDEAHIRGRVVGKWLWT